MTSSETSTTTNRTINFTVTATGEGSPAKTKTATVSTGKQEANPITGISLSIGGSTTTASVVYGSTVETVVKATFKSGTTNVTITPTSITSSDPTVAQIL